MKFFNLTNSADYFGIKMKTLKKKNKVVANGSCYLSLKILCVILHIFLSNKASKLAKMLASCSIIIIFKNERRKKRVS